MRKTAIALFLAVLPLVSFAAEHAHLDKAPVNLGDKDSLMRGAKYFVNYCLSCHSAKFMRFSRMAADLGLSEEEVKNNLMFAAEKIGETMTVAMRPADATQWFGVAPPDLSVIARARGADWLYTYLHSFYLDGSRPFGVNNLVFKDVAMPDVLWELQGLMKPVYATVTNEEGQPEKVIERLEPADPASATPDKQRQFDLMVGDLVNFLVYMGEPAKADRQHLGLWVVFYLVIFLIVAYALKKEYWKDVH